MKNGVEHKPGSNVSLYKHASVYFIQIYDLAGFWITTAKAFSSLKEAREAVKVLRKVLD